MITYNGIVCDTVAEYLSAEFLLVLCNCIIERDELVKIKILSLASWVFDIE